MKRILSLDGGGVRGVFTLQILNRMEQLLRDKAPDDMVASKRKKREQLVLADYFDFIGGCSTGAIIAACLSWGMSVQKITDLYREQCSKVFSSKNILRRFWSTYRDKDLAELLQREFSEDDGSPALLGSSKLRTLLLIVMRNAGTGAPWPVTNNPHAKFNVRTQKGCNLDLPLWQLIRASTAAPVFFPPEEMDVGDQTHVFIDGAITPFNNPSYIMFLGATLPCYKVCWETGVDKMLLVSVGTGRMRIKFPKKDVNSINVLDQASHSVLGLIDTSALYQDFLCRISGECLAGDEIDSEVGAMIGDQGNVPWQKHFNYVRYNQEFKPEKVAELAADKRFFAVDRLKSVNVLEQMGRDYARQNVKPEHLRF